MTGAPEEVERTPRPRALVVGLLTAFVLVVLDQLTKELAESLLARGEFVPWPGGGAGFELVYNPGGAFGFAAPSILFLVVTVLVIGLVATALPRSSSLVAAGAYGMLLAGALGNAIDRLFRTGDPEGGFGAGYVVDFVAWGTFPRFNLADSSITVGFVLLALAVLAEERRERRHRAGLQALGEESSTGDGGLLADERATTLPDPDSSGDGPASGESPAGGQPPATGGSASADDAADPCHDGPCDPRHTGPS